jgi:L-fucose isomerase
VPNLTGEGVFHDVYNVMKSWGANHCAFGYGHNGADLITLASMLRIPVSLHNVEEARIFRPSAWDHFGAGDPIGADFRASANFGPVYKPRM